jgi:hypothetical protein
MFVAPLRYTMALLPENTAVGKSIRYSPGIFVASTATNPPDAYAAVELARVTKVIAVGVPRSVT